MYNISFSHKSLLRTGLLISWKLYRFQFDHLSELFFGAYEGKRQWEFKYQRVKIIVFYFIYLISAAVAVPHIKPGEEEEM